MIGWQTSFGVPPEFPSSPLFGVYAVGSFLERLRRLCGRTCEAGVRPFHNLDRLRGSRTEKLTATTETIKARLFIRDVGTADAVDSQRDSYISLMETPESAIRSPKQVAGATHCR